MNTQKLNRKTKMENREMNNQLQIELKEDVAQGTYANLAVITHSSSEFIVDFVRVMPGMPKASVKSRIVLAPEHAINYFESHSKLIQNILHIIYM